MSEQEDPAQQEIERLARGEALGIAGTDENALDSGDQRLETDSTTNSSSAADTTVDQHETSGDETPGYQ